MIKILRQENIVSRKRARAYHTRIRNVDHLMTRLIEEWQPFDQQIIDRAIKQWRSCLRLWVREQGGHFKHQFLLNFIG